MRKLLFSLLCLLPAVAAAEPVSRRSADVYVSDDGRTAYATVGCTQTASGMESRVEVNSVTGRPHLVFYDSSGEEEADCQVSAVVRARGPRSSVTARAVVGDRVEVRGGGAPTRKVAARTRQTARVAVRR